MRQCPPRRRRAQDKARVSVARLQRLTRGFGAFTVAGIQPTPGAGARPLGAPTAQLVSQPARDALRLVLSADGSYLQARRCPLPWPRTGSMQRRCFLRAV